MAPVSQTVLVFDSGAGALSIGGEIHRLLPHLNILYAMDRAGFPYGDWDEARLTHHICATLQSLVAEHAPDLVVLACNSASTAVLPALRSTISQPVVGVVPAIKPAAALSRSRVIGLLATPGTVARRYTDQLIDDFAGDCTVIRVGSGELAPAVERWLWQGEPVDAACAAVIAGFSAHPDIARLDTLVLACTHFPLVREQLASALPDVTLVDSGAAIARRVAQLLGAGGEGVGRQRALVLTQNEIPPDARERLAVFEVEALLVTPSPTLPHKWGRELY